MPQTLFGSDTLGHTMSTQVLVYTDGGSDPNPGPGGWGAIICWEEDGGREWTLSGNDPETSNNRMELHAAIAALGLLESVLGRCQVALHTDSQYLRRGITEWLDGWISRGWRTKGKKAVKNQDLWQVLHRLTQAHDVTWHWVKGHAGDPLNERADQLATQARERLQAARVISSPSTPRRDDNRPSVEISVKASHRGSTGLGGWGAILRMDDHARSLSDSAPATSVNRMLILGATRALQALTRPCRVTLYSDANYLIQGASQWVKGWQARGWQTKEGKPVANRDAWETLIEAAQPHHVTWVQVKGDEAPDDLAWAGELATEATQSKVSS